MLLPINPAHPEPRKIQRAAALLADGAVIGYPTDTVYGLGCDLMSKQAIEQLYVIKGMKRDHHLAFICPDLSDIARYAVVDDWAYRIMKRLVPGPYVLILPASREVPKMVHRKKKTVGIRVPDNPVTLALVRELGRPLISTTAAPPGEEPMVDPWEIDERFPGLALVLDAGAGGTVPTTILDLSEGALEVVREGAGSIEGLV